MNDLHMARIFIEQARARRGNPKMRSFRAVLLNWAAERRRNHFVSATKKVGQMDMFAGGVA